MPFNMLVDPKSIYCISATPTKHPIAEAKHTRIALQINLPTPKLPIFDFNIIRRTTQIPA